MEAPKNIIKTVYSDAKALIKGADADVNKALDRTNSVIHDVIDGTKQVIITGEHEADKTLSNVGESFAMPLTIGAVILLIKN